jgi:hypothetical protein
MNVLSRVSVLALLLAVVNAHEMSESAKERRQQGQNPILYASATNTNMCLSIVGNIARNIENCVNLQVRCCQQVVKASSAGCFENLSMQALFGNELVANLENTLLPQCRSSIPVEDEQDVTYYNNLRTNKYQ